MCQAIKLDSCYPTALRMHFFNVRVNAEIKARERLAELEEVTLEAIYLVIQEEYNLKDLETRKLRDLEVHMEIESVYPIDETVFRIKQLLSSGHKVILVSDMYLPLDTVKSMLERLVPDFSELPIYLSSEVGLQKRTGNLYRYVLEKEKIAPSELKHIGDNHQSDFYIPKKLGIEAEKFKESGLTGLEKQIIRNYDRENDVTRQLVGGVSRKMRLHSLRSNRFTPMVSIFGPLLYGFIHDVLKKMLNLGKKRVYFISRDGRPLKIVADEIIAAFNYPLETCYLHGSRQAWRQASIFEPKYDLYWLAENFIDADYTLRQVLDRIDGNVDKIYLLLPEKLRKHISLEKVVTDKNISEVCDAIASHQPLRDHILSLSRKKRQNALKYFKKNGLFDGTPAAFVDIGWTGKMQHCLYAILLSDSSEIHIDEFYFALDDSFAPCESDFNNVKHYYYTDIHLAGINDLANFMELFVQGDHGRCMGYNSDGEPVHDGKGQYLIDWGVREYYDCLKVFIQNYVKASQGVCYLEKFEHLIKDMKDAMYLPTKQMAELFGSLPFSGDQNDALMSEFAPALNPSELRRSLLGAVHLRWIEGSLLRSSPLVRKMYRRMFLLFESRNYIKMLFDQMKITKGFKRVIKKVFMNPAGNRRG